MSGEYYKFLETIPREAREKMLRNIARVAHGEMNRELFKKLQGEIWEFRVGIGGCAYRL